MDQILPLEHKGTVASIVDKVTTRDHLFINIFPIVQNTCIYDVAISIDQNIYDVAISIDR